ncbi:MAG: DMT family transporter [Thermodesulfobacteriota bacterium]
MDDPDKANRPVELDATIAGPLFMLSAALLFTLHTLFIKLIGPDFTIWHIGFYRFTGGLIVLLAVFGRQGNPYRGNDLHLLVIRGCVGTASFIAIVTAIRMLPISTALVIFYSFPAFSAIFSFLLYRERIGKLETACIVVAVIGVCVLFDFQVGGELLGHVLAIVGSIFGGLTVTLIQALRKKNGPVIIYLYFCTVGAIITLPNFIMHPVFPSTALEWIMVLGIIFTSATAQLLMNQGFFYCKGWEGGVFMSSEVVFTAVVGIVCLGDPATLKFWSGGLMIFGSVVALNRLKSEKGKRRASLK